MTIIRPAGTRAKRTSLPPLLLPPVSGQITTLNVDGNVFAQPLIVSNFTMPDSSTHDVLIVATGHNSVYAYDAHSYAVLWHINLGTSQSTNDVGCGDIQPEYGISSTPVIVRTARLMPPRSIWWPRRSPRAFRSTPKSMRSTWARRKDTIKPVEIAPGAKFKSGGKIHFDPQNQWNRASLVLSNNSIYVGVGSHCDNNAGNISGWMLALRHQSQSGEQVQYDRGARRL